MKKLISIFLIVFLMISGSVLSVFGLEVEIDDLQATQIHLKKEEEKTLVFEIDDLDESKIVWINNHEDKVQIELNKNQWVVKGLSYGSAYLRGYYEGELRFDILVQIFDSMAFMSSSVQLDIFEPFESNLVFQPATSLEQFKPEYKSSNESVASVDEHGVIVAHKIGKAIIMASYLGERAIKNVEVIDRPDFAFLESRQVIEVDSSVNIEYRLSIFEPGLDKTIVWSTKNNEIASVDQKGNIYGHQSGSTSVVAVVNGKEYTTEVIVLSNVEAIEFLEESISLHVGQEKTVGYRILPDVYQNIPITWLSSRPSVVRVSNGVLTGIGAGDATITARINDIEATLDVSVSIPLTGISISPSRLTLQQGQRSHLRISPKPSNATQTLSLTYKSSDESVLLVDDFGNVTAIKQGSAFVFVSHEEFSTSIEVVVNFSEDEQGQKVVFGSLNSAQVVMFDLRGLDSVSEHRLEIPMVTKTNALGQIEVLVQLNEAAYSDGVFHAGALQLGSEYERQDILVKVIDGSNQELFTYQLFDFDQAGKNIFASNSLIQSSFDNFSDHLVEFNLPINLKRMDRLEYSMSNTLNEDYRLYEDLKNNLRLVSAKPLTMSADGRIVFSDLEDRIYYLTDQPLESKITQFMLIMAVFMILVISYYFIRKYYEKEIVLEKEKRSRYESVNYKQQEKQNEENE